MTVFCTLLYKVCMLPWFYVQIEFVGGVADTSATFKKPAAVFRSRNYICCVTYSWAGPKPLFAFS